MVNPEMNLDTTCVADLPEKQKIAFLKAFSKMACLDGNFDEMEKEFIEKMAVAWGIDSNSVSEIFENLSEDEIIKQVSVIENRRVALELIKEMCVLAHADDNLSDEEILFIGKVGEAMGVELEKVEQISNWVIDRLIWLEKGRIIFEEV